MFDLACDVFKFMNDNFISKKPNPGEPWDVVIIGSGPASFSAAIYTTRGAASTLILGGENWGGQLMLTTAVDNFPGFPEGILGPDLMLNMKKQAERFGAEFKAKNVDKLFTEGKNFKAFCGSDEFLAKSVIIATGAQTVWLDVPGEKELIGRGVSSCAPCDAPFFKDKVVAVVGGGDSAMEEALVLTKYAKKVYLIHRRDSFKASAVMQEKVKSNKKIEILWNSEVKKINGEQKVASIEILNNIDNSMRTIELDGIFVAIGHSPSSLVFKGLIDMDEKGFIRRLETNGYKTTTNIEGIFVAGDVHDFHYKQAITAAGFGAMAALDVLNFLQNLKTP